MIADWRRPAWVWDGAAALAAARTGIGLVALAAPELVGRPWVGEAAGTAQGRLLARALGGRDLALGLGTLAALRRVRPGGPDGVEGWPDGLADAGRWVGMSAAADSLDVLATVGAWPKLPAVGRWLVALSAGGAAVAGGAAAWVLITGQAGPPEAQARPPEASRAA
jgi:hypothetical protein